MGIRLHCRCKSSGGYGQSGNTWRRGQHSEHTSSKGLALEPRWNNDVWHTTLPTVLPVPKCRYSGKIKSCCIDSRQTADGLMLTDDDCDRGQRWPRCHPLADAADQMNTTTTVSKRTYSPSPSSGEVNKHSAKFNRSNPRTFASVAASPSARAVPPRQPQPHNPKLILIRSAEGSRCFIHPEKVARAI